LKAQTLSKFASAALLSTALGAAMFVSAPAVYADDDRGKCHHRVEKAESKLDEAVRKHGERSRQAESRRRALNEERERCWRAYHGWWNGQEHRWHGDHDWDDHR
jgi:hypothetical protein